MECPWQPCGKPWENNVSAVRLTVSTGAGSRQPLESYSFPELLKFLGKTSFCEVEPMHHTFTSVIACHIEKASITNTTDMTNLVHLCKGRKPRKPLGKPTFLAKGAGATGGPQVRWAFPGAGAAGSPQRTGQCKITDFHVGGFRKTSENVLIYACFACFPKGFDDISAKVF